MTDARANSGVRNLRAMFESQSAASSPEPRGRSPSRRINVDADRPTSKVKASFVSVQPSGLISPGLGTTKGTTDGLNSAEAQRRESFSISKDLGEETVEQLKKVVSEEKEARRKSEAITEVVPEQVIESREASVAPPPIQEQESTMPNLGSIMKGSDFPEPQVAQGDKASNAESDKAGEATPLSLPVGETGTPEKESGTNKASKTGARVENIEEELAALSVADQPGDNPDKPVTGVQEEASLKPADPKDEATVSGGQALPAPTEVLPVSHDVEHEAKASVPVESAPDEHRANGARAAPRGNRAAAAKKPAAISVSKASSSKAAPSKSPMPKSPGAARLPRTPTAQKPVSTGARSKSGAPAKEQPKVGTQRVPPKAPTAKTSQTSLGSSKSTTTTSSAAKAKAPVTQDKKPASRPTSNAPAPKAGTTTSPGGFKKPRPKSPTRPVRLPSHLTAPTAAFAAKHGEDSNHKAPSKPSTVSRPAAAASKPTSTVKKPTARGSLAPNGTPEKRPSSRASTAGNASDSFLTRMMRPTASSASKTHEKPASPPRRGTSLRASVKPKAAQQSTVGKAKAKVAEVASKAKDAVTNGHNAESRSKEEASASLGVAPTDTVEHKPTEAKAETSQDNTEAAQPEQTESPKAPVEAAEVAKSVEE